MHWSALNFSRDLIVRIYDSDNLHSNWLIHEHLIFKSIWRDTELFRTRFDVDPVDQWLNWTLAQDFSHETRWAYNALWVDFNAINIINLLTFFISMSSMTQILVGRLTGYETRTKERVDNFQSLLTRWIQFQTNQPGIKNVPDCPSHLASAQKWTKFGNAIQKIIEKTLSIDLNISWNSEDYQATLDYLMANQLFWDCLQVARVENREAIEDMILNAPDDNE